jgi:hypothetical protein
MGQRVGGDITSFPCSSNDLRRTQPFTPSNEKPQGRPEPAEDVTESRLLMSSGTVVSACEDLLEGRMTSIRERVRASVVLVVGSDC